ncbi:9060_t:CDS:2, partial [Diversispora eburnea]
NELTLEEETLLKLMMDGSKYEVEQQEEHHQALPLVRALSLLQDMNRWTVQLLGANLLRRLTNDVAKSNKA